MIAPLLFDCSQANRLRRANACEGCCPGPLFREFFIFPVGQGAFGFLREDYSPRNPKARRNFLFEMEPQVDGSCATGSAAPIHGNGGSVCFGSLSCCREGREQLRDVVRRGRFKSRRFLPLEPAKKRSCSANTRTGLVRVLVGFHSLVLKCFFEFATGVSFRTAALICDEPELGA